MTKAVGIALGTTNSVVTVGVRHGSVIRLAEQGTSWEAALGAKVETASRLRMLL